jgi:ribosomal protein S18 acetylase RimI-like enzyme
MSDDDDADVLLRPYRDDDCEAVVALWEACGLCRPWNNPRRDLALFAASANARILVGELGGEPGGAVVATLCAGHDGHRGWPYYLAVAPEERRRGLGRRLMGEAERWLTGLEIPKMNLMVRGDNAEVASFYRALGYRREDRIVMSRWLGEAGRERAEAQAREAPDLEVVVTYLEMPERPSEPPLPAPRGQKIALLRALDPPLAFYRYLYDRVGEPWLWYERRAMDDETLGRIIGDQRVEIYVLYVEGVPAGFAELDRRGRSDINFAYFGLCPEFIGRGLGPYLLTAAIDIAWSYEPKRLTVDTCTLDHYKALALYQRHGFRPYRQEPRTIADPRAEGLLPWSAGQDTKP